MGISTTANTNGASRGGGNGKSDNGDEDGNELGSFSMASANNMIRDLYTAVTDNYTGANTSAITAVDEISLFKNDVLFWLGDLNYRIDAGKDMVLRMVEEERWKELSEDCNQLSKWMRRRNVFRGFQEGGIRFAPTYKLHRDRDEYERNEIGELEKVPSYMDRILWKIHTDSIAGKKGDGDGDFDGDVVELNEYNRCNVYGSDHRPVYANFDIHLGIVDKEKKDSIRREVQEEMDHRFNRLRPSIDISDHNAQFGYVSFDTPTRVSIELHSKS